jgi:endogenous inhibitor of DNA gyrase (YacG/DUF329 family)
MQARPPRIVACPRCGARAPFGPENPSRPFCSERCRLIDLGAWANESYRVPDTTPPDPEPEGPN